MTAKLLKVEPMVREVVVDLMAARGWPADQVDLARRGRVDIDSFFATQAAQRAVDAERARAAGGSGGASKQAETLL